MLSVLLPFALSNLKHDIEAVFAWLSHRSFWQLVCMALAASWGIDHVASHRFAAKLQRQLTACTSARHADAERYAKAQSEAQAANHAQVQKIEQQYQRNSDDERQSYLRDLAELKRLRQHSAPQGSPGGPGASPPSTAPGGADGDELHLPPDEHLQASEIELRLMHLQNWVVRQLGVDPNAR